MSAGPGTAERAVTGWLDALPRYHLIKGEKLPWPYWCPLDALATALHPEPTRSQTEIIRRAVLRLADRGRVETGHGGPGTWMDTWPAGVGKVPVRRRVLVLRPMPTEAERAAEQAHRQAEADEHHQYVVDRYNLKPAPVVTRPAGLGSATLSELVWEVARRLDAIGPPTVERGFGWRSPELEELLEGRGPLRGYGGHHDATGVPDVAIMPASEAQQLLSDDDEDDNEDEEDQ